MSDEILSRIAGWCLADPRLTFLEADRRGADAFMTKPFEPETLRATIARLLTTRTPVAASGPV